MEKWRFYVITKLRYDANLTYNLCRVEHLLSGKKGFSLQNLKKEAFNTFFVGKILQNLGFCPELIKNTPAYQNLIQWGKIDSENCP